MNACRLLCLANLLAAGWAGAVPVDRAVRHFFDEHCVKCHNEDKAKGDLRLDDLKGEFDTTATRQVWQQVLEKMETGEMPPKSKPRPSAEALRSAADWIGARVLEANAKLRATEGRVVLRRLNRAEYENTVHDLLGVDTKLKDLLPQDGAAGGFDNVGDALHTSSFLMERYLEAAQTALDQAITNRPKPPKSEVKRVGLKEAYQVRSTSEKVFRKVGDETVVMFSSSKWVAANLFYINERGRYRFRISASGIQSAGKPVTFSVQSGSGGMGGPKGHLVDYFDAPPDKPREFEFTDFMEPKTSIIILPYDLPSAQTVNKVGAETWDGPGLAVHWVEMEGPINETWPPASHRGLFGDLKQASFPGYNQRDRVEVVPDDPEKDSMRLLGQFARRAFRRPVTEAEVAPFVALVKRRMGERSTFEQAMRAGFAAVMTSPHFLFLREQPGRLDDLALASRLSYFLWSTMPDEELQAAAEHGKLSQPAVLHAQVERLLNSPKAHAFTENFLGQWLNMRELDFTEPTHLLYPEYDDMLRASMLKETHLFFEEVLKKDMSLTNFLASDFSMLNGRLARHYGIAGVDGWDFQRVSLPAESHRGGVLTMASVLKVTANGSNTSPVLRGAWILDRILGTPPKPPPPDVPAIEPDTRGATTMREQLAKHRQIESCATCHTRIDPPGFALESFDVIGGWRENYRCTGNGKPVVIDGRKMQYLTGKPVDPADVLPDGRKFANIDEFKKLLLADKDQFARALAIKLLTYATGGLIEATDQRQVGTIVEKTKARHDGFRSLIHEIVQSELFRSK